ncbi:HpcH/HpaI aldolase/citrate lyase family protein [Brevundimonas bullata]|uniref:HpcH/HpaI aldolase/citrate lyase family protein n=1 Tax=Brevundimonas bullata TaxID=13160 RepID=UPI0019BD6694|nr:CoA ester lyase [Brevundimonas sp.]
MTTVWRSLQYVPAHRDKHVTSSRLAQADGVILDLEDAVPAEDKAAARKALKSAVKVVGRWGADVLVRINAEPDLADADIAAAVAASAGALVVPKVESADDILRLEPVIAAAERAAGREVGATRLVVLIETARGFLSMSASLGASARIAAVNLGNEDFARDLGVEPSEELLTYPRQQMIIAAVAAGVLPLGLAGPATRFDDLDAYRRLAERSRRLGHVGATCIHPDQIAVLNQVFAPSEAEVSEALAIVDAARMAGQGAFAVNGRMIDKPVLSRAVGVLDRKSSIESKSKSSSNK